MGIFAMLVVTGGVLAGFATFFVHLMRRARLAADPPIRLRQATSNPPKLQRRRELHAKAGAGHDVPDVQEGTAQC